MEDVGVGTNPNPNFWSGKRVLLTGHTGFKGAWLTYWLGRLGAKVYGFALPPEGNPNLFSLLQLQSEQVSVFGDVRDLPAVSAAISEARPDIAIHMAAQSLVRRSYSRPVDTFSTNVMGTVHILSALQGSDGLMAVLIVTSDKVYQNQNSRVPFVETDKLGGEDPYSSSKAAAEIVANCWAQSYFQELAIPVATARAGNVIGGGDWSEDRLIPDIWRSARAGNELELRYPEATRPWQHVLDPLAGYLKYLEAIAATKSGVPKALNFGPATSEILTVGEIATAVSASLGSTRTWHISNRRELGEMKHLSIDASLATKSLGWKPRLSAADALQWTVDWYKSFDSGIDVRKLTERQILSYEKLA